MKSTGKGIFLHRTPYSESSLITTFLTRESGLRKFIFKGGKKKAHHIFPMSVSEISFYGRADSELLNLTGVEPALPLSFQFDPVKGTIAFFMAEVVRKCQHEGDTDEGFYDFIESAVLELNESENLALFPLWFLLELAENLGFKPLCENEEYRYFNLDAGAYQMTASQDQRTVSDAGVELIKRMLLNNDHQLDYKEQHNRKLAMDTILLYYSIHIPKFREVESYEIVREILSA